MILGKITGKVTTKNFTFAVTQEVKNLEYIKVYHPTYDYVLCQVTELIASTKGMNAQCNIIGYRDDRLKHIRIPFEPGTEVLLADDKFIKKIIDLPDAAAYIGKIEGRDIDVRLDLQKMLTKHVSVLAKSGAGKSYTVGVLLEEILEQGVPCIIIDPHGEHGTLNRAEKNGDKKRMAIFGVKPKKYDVVEYGQPTDTVQLLQLSNKLTRQEIMHMLPKLNTTQQGLLYQAVQNSEHTNFDELIQALEEEESMTKWSLIHLIEGLRSYSVFSSNPIPPTELIKPGRATAINLKGYAPDMQELIVYKLAKDLYDLRKENKIAPFFLVIEEAHNFCPERSFGEVASSKILRTIASEGRKFGMGLCIISQRPARVDKSVLSQCTTQIIMKLTNPHDLKAVSNSVEGLTAETEKEIKNLPVGTALVTGVVDLPLVVNIRPRRTAHGGDAVNILDNAEHQIDDTAELRPLILPPTTKKDMELMHSGDIETRIRPATRFLCGEDNFPIIIDRTRNELVMDYETTKKLPQLKELGKTQRAVLTYLFKNKYLHPVQQKTPKKILQQLIAAGYITRATKETYKLSNKYHFAKIQKASFAAAISYEKITARKLRARYTTEEAAEQLQRYTKINDSQECWILEYVVKK